MILSGDYAQSMVPIVGDSHDCNKKKFDKLST